MFVDSGLTETPLVDLVDIVCFLNEVLADFLPLYPLRGFSLFFLSTGLELLWAFAALAVLFTTLVVEGLVFEDRVAAFALALGSDPSCYGSGVLEA